MKKIVALVALFSVLLSGEASAANWDRLGSGYGNKGPFDYYIDTTTIEKIKALRGVWIKYDFKKQPVYTTVNYSISCVKNTFVQISLAVYDLNGNVIGYDGEFSNQVGIIDGSVLEDIKQTVCKDYVPPSFGNKRYAPYTPNVPGPF